MRFNDVYSAVQDAKNKVATAAQLSHSNKLLSKKKKELFKSFDKNIHGVMSAVTKTQKMEFPKYKYIEPTDTAIMSVVDKPFVKTLLTTQLESLSATVDKLKEEKFKVVDPHTNTSENLKTAAKTLFSKALGDLESLVKLF